MKDVLAIMAFQAIILCAFADYKTGGLNENGQYLIVGSAWYFTSWFLHWLYTNTKT